MLVKKFNPTKKKQSKKNPKLHYKKFEIYKSLAKAKGGKLLSKVYKGTKERYLFKCKIESHKPWFAVGYSIESGSWCPACSKHKKGDRSRKYSVDFCHELAKKKGGVFLSKKYSNTSTKLKWKCSRKSHSVFFMSLSKILHRGNWCPKCGVEKCANANRKTLEDMSEFAKKRKGKCLSNFYKNKDTKIEWKCHKPEHPSWFATPGNIRNGRWCPECALERFGQRKQKASEKWHELLDN